MTSTRSLLVPLIAIVLGTFMVILDTTVVNVALPTLGQAFGTDLSLLHWVIGAYLLAQATTRARTCARRCSRAVIVIRSRCCIGGQNHRSLDGGRIHGSSTPALRVFRFSL